MHDQGRLLINVFSTDGRGFFWNKCNLVRSLVQYFKIFENLHEFFSGLKYKAFFCFTDVLCILQSSLKTYNAVGGFYDLMDDCVSLLVLMSRNYEINVFHYFDVLKLAFKNTVLKCYSSLYGQFIGINSIVNSGHIPFPYAWWFKCKMLSKNIVGNYFCQRNYCLISNLIWVVVFKFCSSLLCWFIFIFLKKSKFSRISYYHQLNNFENTTSLKKIFYIYDELYFPSCISLTDYGNVTIIPCFQFLLQMASSLEKALKRTREKVVSACHRYFLLVWNALFWQFST